MQKTAAFAPEQVQQAMGAFLNTLPTTTARVFAVEAALSGGSGKQWRREFGVLTTRLIPLDALVPASYAHWRPFIRESMIFVVSRLSADRLAPKIVEQIELPADTPPEDRLLRLIAKVPGLQKLGQVVARNRNLPKTFRLALSQLENGISDVTIGEIRPLILEQLGACAQQYDVRIGANILSEASVSAVVPFTWRNPEGGRRERGVFKVLKPHIPACYAEDMAILQQLVGDLVRLRRRAGYQFSDAAETLTEVRLLLEHEVDFRREQKTLLEAYELYRSLPGVRVPRLIEPLSTATMTALSHEQGAKVTTALARSPESRDRVARQLALALLVVPSLTLQDHVLFHADPHAGNLLFDRRRGEVVILDWALTDCLTRDQRRHLTVLVLMTSLQDPEGMCAAIERLRQHRPIHDDAPARVIRECVADYLRRLPLTRVPGPLGALELLDEIAMQGIRLPASLLMFRKAAFTLDGVLRDITGSRVRVDGVMAEYAATHWPETLAALCWVLPLRDWMALEWSVLTIPTRWWRRWLDSAVPAVAGAVP